MADTGEGSLGVKHSETFVLTTPFRPLEDVGNTFKA